jgi:hypothetical protein
VAGALVDTWLPIHDRTESQVWQRIRASGVPYHPAAGDQVAELRGRSQPSQRARSTRSPASSIRATGISHGRCDTATRSCAASMSSGSSAAPGRWPTRCRQQRRGGQRPNSHHDPMQSFRSEGRLRYNPPVPTGYEVVRVLTTTRGRLCPNPVASGEPVVQGVAPTRYRACDCPQSPDHSVS